MGPDSQQEFHAQEKYPRRTPPRDLLQRPSALHSATLLSAAILALAAIPAGAVSCTTQAGLQPSDREALLTAGNTFAEAVAAQNLDLLQSSLLPAVTGDWEGIRTVAQGAKPLVQGGNLAWGDAYLLDATELKAPADTQFFCTNADSQATMTVNLRNLPPGRYALMIGDYTGAPLAGQLALILGTDASAGGKWKLGGMFAREGALEGHDGVWYWTRARELAGKKAVWPAWFSYDAARWLLLPVDFLSSPHLEKLNREQSQAGSNPADALPLTVTGDGGKSWKITALHLDATLHHDDLALAYEGSGLTEPQAARAEAVAVMSSLLKLHPDLRENFHGLWAYAEKDGRQSYAIELAMHDIP
jgi:hypothetical protein